MVQQIQALTMQTQPLKLDPWDPHKVEGEGTTLLSCPLTSTHTNNKVKRRNDPSEKAAAASVSPDPDEPMRAHRDGISKLRFSSLLSFPEANPIPRLKSHRPKDSG